MTAELKDIEEKILNAEEKIGLIETTLFAELRAKVAIYTETIQKNAQLLASIDCLQSYAQVSVENNYVKPLINESTDLNIVKGRHPVVEKLLPIGETYTANNTTMNNTEELIHIITGPNMSGKSSYLRQTALIVLMGQIGCFVPAESAEFGLVDRIFTRVGAQDNITAGESTFLVEMQEAANIMNNATERSLILLDEVGRGTATFDGISIAWSIAEYIHNKICAKTLFATHYHELNDLAARYSKIVNYSVEVIEAGHTVIFSHNVVKGATDHSFGIFVAKMAGMPYDVITRAEEILEILENGNEDGSGAKAKPDMSKVKSKKQKHQTDQLAIFEFRDDELRERLSEIKIENITPIQALQLLSDLHIEAKKSK
jgi:DNA mismatch repair protein MutS